MPPTLASVCRSPLEAGYTLLQLAGTVTESELLPTPPSFELHAPFPTPSVPDHAHLCQWPEIKRVIITMLCIIKVLSKYLI